MKNNNENNRNQLQNSKINLEQLEKGNPFKVPVGYFDELPGRLSDAVNQQQVKPDGRIRYFQTALSIAAILTVVLVAAWYLNISEQDIKKQQVSITYDDIIVSGLITEYDDNTLINHYFSSYEQSDDNSQSDTYIDEYKDYLIQNDIDINILINEL